MNSGVPATEMQSVMPRVADVGVQWVGLVICVIRCVIAVRSDRTVHTFAVVRTERRVIQSTDAVTVQPDGTDVSVN